MSEREKCDKKSDEVPPAPDDWENAGDDAIIASVAERQKQLEQNETNLAAEQEQLKIHQKASGNKTEKNRPEVGEGPIRLLRRQHIGNQQQKTEAELEAEAQERATKALEEREALYQQTRERIFGGEQPPSQQPPEPVSSESLQAQLQLHLQQQQQMQQQQSSGPRDHLSDVQMKRADTRKPGQRQQQIPQQPPPLNSLPMMMPPTSIPPPQVPWFFNGAPPPQPLYNIPPPQSMYGAPIPPSSQPPIYGGPGFPVGMPPPPPANFYQYQQYYQQQLQGNPRNRYRY
jgi:hypothetical protein